MEDAEWIYKGGTWVPMFIETAQEKIKDAPKSKLMETKLEVFKTFLSKL